jgi:hypothetical protein
MLSGAPSAARLVLIRSEENLGFSGGNNVAFHYALHRRAPPDYVFLLNNDAAPQVDCLTLLVGAERSTGAGIAGAVVLMGNGPGVEFANCRSQLAIFFAPIVKSCVPMPEGGEASWESLFVHGAAMLIRKDVLEAVHLLGRGYLDDRLFLFTKKSPSVVRRGGKGLSPSWCGTPAFAIKAAEVREVMRIPSMPITLPATGSSWRGNFSPLAGECCSSWRTPRCGSQAPRRIFEPTGSGPLVPGCGD